MKTARRTAPRKPTEAQTIDPKRPARVLVASYGGARFFVRFDPKLGPKLEIDLTGVPPALRARAEALRGGRP